MQDGTVCNTFQYFDNGGQIDWVVISWCGFVLCFMVRTNMGNFIMALNNLLKDVVSFEASVLHRRCYLVPKLLPF